MTDKEKPITGTLVEAEELNEVQLDQQAKKGVIAHENTCAWTQFYYDSRNRSPKQSLIIRYKTGCSSKSHGVLSNFCPDCGGKPIVTVSDDIPVGG